jgi:hypothetical protein
VKRVSGRRTLNMLNMKSVHDFNRPAIHFC